VLLTIYTGKESWKAKIPKRFILHKGVRTYLIRNFTKYFKCLKYESTSIKCLLHISTKQDTYYNYKCNFILKISNSTAELQMYADDWHGTTKEQDAMLIRPAAIITVACPWRLVEE